jgi:hypothetical protein
MGSGLFNVIYITLGDFTPVHHFCELFEVLTAVKKTATGALPQPIASKLYTKAALKANPQRLGGR